MGPFGASNAAGRRHIVIHDPASGRRKFTYAQASRHFTGVALELTPATEFAFQAKEKPLRLIDLTGRIIGLKRALAQIFALACALEFFALLSPLFLQLTLDKAVKSANLDLLTTLGIGFMLLVLVQALLTGLRGWTTLYFGTSLKLQWQDRKSTRLNSSHQIISYAVFCLKKKTTRRT